MQSKLKNKTLPNNKKIKIKQKIKKPKQQVNDD